MKYRRALRVVGEIFDLVLDDDVGYFVVLVAAFLLGFAVAWVAV